MTENTTPQQPTPAQEAPQQPAPAQAVPVQPTPVQAVPVQPAPAQTVVSAAALTPEQRMAIEARLANEKKSVGVAYLLWFFLGYTGAQNFYVGRKVLAWIELLLLICCLVGCAFGAYAGAEAGASVNTEAGLDPEGAAFFGGLLGSLTYASVPCVILGLFLLFDLFTLPSAIKSHLDKRRNELILAETGVKTNI